MINFFNTHLSYRDDHNHIRVQQVQQIKDFISQQEIVFPGIGSILTGDFNCTPGSDPISLLTNTGTDTFYLDTYFEANPTSAGFTFTSTSPHKRIDFIFYKNIGQLTIDTSLIVMNQPYSGNNYCSDHLGVMTIFSESSTGIEKQEINYAPEIFKLYQNHPNPFNPTTTIKYDLKKPEQVVIKIYNSIGQEVTTVLNDFRPSGHYSILWNANGQSSGIYFFQMIADGFKDTKKCLLLK